MTRCVIIDDEPLAISLLESHVAKISDLELIQSFTDPLKAIPILNAEKVDLIFVDIQMPELTGLQLAKIIGKSIPIVFTTAYPKYAVEGFELDVADYLVKPISLERFIQSVNKIKSKLSAQVPNSNDKPENADYIFVKTEYRHQKIMLDNIQFLKGESDYVSIHTESGRILTLENLKSFIKRLPKQQFFRVHKSYIVALDKIDHIERNRIAIGEQHIPISASYQKEFWELVKGS